MTGQGSGFILGAAVFPAVEWMRPPRLPEPALDSAVPGSQDQDVVIVGKSTKKAKENKDQL